MALDLALAAWMTDTVQVRKNTGAAGGGYGGAGFAAAKGWKVRIEQVTRRAISAATGEDVVSSTTLYGRPAYEDGTPADVALNDEVTLPAGYAPQQPPVISVRRHNDEDGALHHLEVLLLKVTVVIENQDQVLGELRRMGDAGVRAGKKVILATIRRVAAKAKPLTPVDPEDGGALQDTVRSTGVSVTRSNRISGAVVAGGKKLVARVGLKRARIYPTVQHEDLTLHHGRGQAKFIEIPFLQEIVRVPGALMEELDREVGSR